MGHRVRQHGKVVADVERHLIAPLLLALPYIPTWMLLAFCVVFYVPSYDHKLQPDNIRPLMKCYICWRKQLNGRFMNGCFWELPKYYSDRRSQIHHCAARFPNPFNAHSIYKFISCYFGVPDFFSVCQIFWETIIACEHSNSWSIPPSYRILP